MEKSDVNGHDVDEFDQKLSLQRKSHATACLVHFRHVIVSTPAMFFPGKPVMSLFLSLVPLFFFQ